MVKHSREREPFLLEDLINLIKFLPVDLTAPSMESSTLLQKLIRYMDIHHL